MARPVRSGEEMFREQYEKFQEMTENLPRGKLSRVVELLQEMGKTPNLREAVLLKDSVRGRQILFGFDAAFLRSIRDKDSEATGFLLEVARDVPCLFKIEGEGWTAEEQNKFVRERREIDSSWKRAITVLKANEDGESLRDRILGRSNYFCPEGRDVDQNLLAVLCNEALSMRIVSPQVSGFVGEAMRRAMIGSDVPRRQLLEATFDAITPLPERPTHEDILRKQRAFAALTEILPDQKTVAGILLALPDSVYPKYLVAAEERFCPSVERGTFSGHESTMEEYLLGDTDSFELEKFRVFRKSLIEKIPESVDEITREKLTHEAGQLVRALYRDTNDPKVLKKLFQEISLRMVAKKGEMPLALEEVVSSFLRPRHHYAHITTSGMFLEEAEKFICGTPSFGVRDSRNAAESVAGGGGGGGGDPASSIRSRTSDVVAAAGAGGRAGGK